MLITPVAILAQAYVRYQGLGLAGWDRVRGEASSPRPQAVLKAAESRTAAGKITNPVTPVHELCGMNKQTCSQNI